MKIKRLLEGLTEERAPGPSPSFSIFHLIKALESMGERGSVGRGRLSKELGIGEGATRTLISRLRAAGLVAASRRGCSLTERGMEVWGQLTSVFPRKVRLEKSGLTLAAHDVAVLVRDRGHRVGSGVAQRDAAVMVGAKGAITLLIRNNRLILPAVSEDVSVDFPGAFSQIAGLMEPEENDVVVIGSAETLEKAEYGALAAAWSLIDD